MVKAVIAGSILGDNAAQRATERQSGYPYPSAENDRELRRDSKLAKRGRDVEWVIDGTAAQPLPDAPKTAGIRATVG